MATHTQAEMCNTKRGLLLQSYRAQKAVYNVLLSAQPWPLFVCIQHFLAIAATPCLSMLTSLLDIDIAEVRSLRDTLNSTSFNGTVMAPHDDALHTLFSALDITPTAFATRYAVSWLKQYLWCVCVCMCVCFCCCVWFVCCHMLHCKSVKDAVCTSRAKVYYSWGVQIACHCHP